MLSWYVLLKSLLGQLGKYGWRNKEMNPVNVLPKLKKNKMCPVSVTKGLYLNVCDRQMITYFS